MRTFLADKKRYERAAAALIAVTVLFALLALFGGSVNADISSGTGRRLGGSMFNYAILISHSLGSAIEPISILMVEAVIALSAKVIPDVLGKYTEYLGFMNNTVMSLVIILMFVVLKVPKMFGITRVAGIAISDIENKAMGIFNFALPFLMFMVKGEAEETGAMAKESASAIASAIPFPAASGIAAAASVSGGLALAGKILLCTVLGLYLLLSYYVMRTVMYAGDVMITLFSGIPGVSIVTESLKTIAVIGVVLISIAAPWVIVALYVAVLIVCIILFKKAYNVTYYFRHVYLYPFFIGKVRRKAIANDLSRSYEKDGKCRIPAFAGTAFNGYARFERCYLQLTGGKAVILPRKGRIARKKRSEDTKETTSKAPYLLDFKPDDKYKLRKGLRYIEIYKEDPDAKVRKIRLPKRKFSIIVSRRYAEAFDLIASMEVFETVENESVVKLPKMKEAKA